MLNVKRAALLWVLSPALSVAAEPQPAESAPAATGSSPARLSLSVPIDQSDARCELPAMFGAMNWYNATVCARLHKAMRPQEEKFKELISSTYPGFHRAITMPPFSTLARQTVHDSPSPPEESFMFTEASCKQNFENMMRSINDAKTRQTIQQCWEQPRAAAKDKPFSPLDDRVCVGTAQYLASAWYKAGMCTSRHKDLAEREAKVKEGLASTYPEFQKTISTPPILDAGKYMATYDLAQWGNDPSLSEEGCEQNLDFLASPLRDTEWKEAVEQCWGKPHAVTQEKSPASR